jgi:pyruvate dehydrogenase E2 component (dihydrolipoamide acetyltransferase)
MHEVTIPALGMAMTEAVLIQWHKHPGDAVAAGDVLAEIETDKSTVELESPADGTLGPHLVSEGDAVPIGDAVVRILAPDETETQGAGPEPTAGADDAVPHPVAEPGRPAPAAADETGPPTPAAADETGPPTPAAADEAARADPGPGRPPHALSPRRRHLARLAAERGEIRPADEAHRPDAPPDVSRTRHAIAERVSQSWREIPHFAVQREIDAAASSAVLATLRARGLAATYTDLLLRALARAVRDTAGGHGDLGLAVATPAGVMMPVVAGIPSLEPAELVAARSAAVRRAREGRLSSADLTIEPVASLSNLGSRGVDAFTGVIATGQRLLLTAGRVRPRPVAIEGGIGVRPTLIATLNVDHRSFDGDLAADVLAAFDREFGILRTWIEGDHR